MLAYLPVFEFEDVLDSLELRRFTRKTITTPEALPLALREVRKCGFALDNGEYEEGLMCIGAPVFDSVGRVIASVAIEGPMSRLQEPPVEPDGLGHASRGGGVGGYGFHRNRSRRRRFGFEAEE